MNKAGTASSVEPDAFLPKFVSALHQGYASRSIRSQLQDCGILRPHRVLPVGHLAHAVRFAKAVAGELRS
jgi:hypothetical protein